MSSDDPRLHTRQWRALRVAVLNRDRWQCQIRLDGCTTQATSVDHVTEPLQGGEFWDPANLRASCRPCNSRRGGRLAASRADRFGYRVTDPPIVTRF
jgi:5-methylcytosine-specific restriction endonuclease McrA